MGIHNDLKVVRNTRKALFHLTMLTSIVAAALSPGVLADDNGVEQALLDNQIQELPFCGDRQEQTVGRRLLYVTTLDGRLSALDITKGGKRRWSIPTGPGSLISSSIHRLELTNNGQFVRMIPSLSGGIYKFDGESIDPIPINTDHLLSSSAKFSDDLVISGGKETRTYGVSARTGQLLYECSMNGCLNSTDAVEGTRPSTSEETDSDDNEYMKNHDPLVDDVIVVRRQTQTVRAVESRTGIERWNFSVGQHDLDLVKPAECHERPYSELDMAILDLEVKVVVPEGIICAFSKSEPNVMLWKYKFDHPIVSAWKIGPSDELISIDMFSSAQWLWNQDGNTFEPLYPKMTPSIYLGMYDKQLYIQESVQIRKEIMDQSSLYDQVNGNNFNLPKIPWRPIAAVSNALIIVEDNKIIGGSDATQSSQNIETDDGSHNNNNNNLHGNELVPYDDESFALSAQSVLNASEFVNGNGFYLIAGNNNSLKSNEELCDTDDPKGQPAIEGIPLDNATNHTMEEDLTFSIDFDNIDPPVKVVILSLWFWWKEIIVIAITSAILFNYLIGQRQRPEREIVVIERHIPVPTAMEATESSTAALLGPATNSSKSTSNGVWFNGQRTQSESSHSANSEQFSSRFQGDFDLLRCLGRGGFGVVFEAKNKLDDCKYAVKRITLPNKKESRDRVMREVKTLANCEHHNIVRYFQAWVETPPPGWQEEEDSKWLAHEMSSTSIQIETPTDGSSLPSSMAVASDRLVANRKLQVAKKKQLISWMSSITSTACSNDLQLDCDDDEEDDSCIIFRSESQSMAHRANADEEEQSEIKRISGGRSDQKSEPIKIDIHSDSFDLSGLTNGNKSIDYSQLSDSFQIEFVRSADGHSAADEHGELHGDSSLTNGYPSTPSTEVFALNDTCKTQKPQRPSKLNLELIPDRSPHNKAPSVLPTNTSSTTPPKQNKVYLYIQMQLCRKESLRDWLRDNLNEARAPHVGRIFYQIVDAVDYVHYKGLIHRDLKPSNIFFSQDGQIKIGDFGLVTDMSDIPNMVTKCGDNTGLPSCARHTQQVGTHLYMSPEQLRGQHYDYKVDIYSLGLIFFELLLYFGTEMERVKTLRALRDECYPKDFPEKHPKEYALLKQMLSQQPEQRPAAEELKQQLNEIFKLPEYLSDSDSLGRRLSRSRTFSSSE